MVGLPLCLVQLPLGPTLQTPPCNENNDDDDNHSKGVDGDTGGNNRRGVMTETVNMGMTAMIATRTRTVDITWQ